MTDETPPAAPAEGQPEREGISTPPAPPEPARPPSRLRRFGAVLWRNPGKTFLAVAALAAAVPVTRSVILPAVRMHVAWTDSAACVANFERPRGRALPSCASFIHDYEHLADHRLTHHDATYRAEELWARIMMASYLNASIGAPDSGERARTSQYVADAQGVLERGSQRISLDELGPAVMAPNLGKFANAVGDRGTLISGWEEWSLWSTREQAIQAALVEGDLAKASAIASGYAEAEPREADLRTTIGAVLCLGPSPAEGVDFLERVPTDRYDKRYASIQRDYGEVLGVLKACAHRARRPPPPLPPAGSAGVANMREARLVESVRLAQDPETLGDALDRVVVALQVEGGVEDRESRWARAYLTAVLVARDAEAPVKPPPAKHAEPPKAPKDPKGAKPAGNENDPGVEDDEAPPVELEPPRLPTLFHDDGEQPPVVDRLEPKLLANLVRPRAQETQLAPPASHVLAQILAEPPRLVPILPAELLASASEKLERIASAVVDPADSSATPIRPVLAKAAGSIAMHAGIAAARFGLPAAAEAQMGRAARLLELDAPTGRLLVAAAIYVAGDRARAIAALAPASGDPAPSAAVEMESALLHARLVAVDDPAGAAADVQRALALAERAADPILTSDARWLELALAPRGAAAGPLLFPVYTGQADIDHRGFARFSQPAVDANFSAWSRAIAGTPEEQLAFRYRLFHQAGDAPSDLGAYLVAGGRLLTDASGASTEVWLDAMTALDRARYTLFAYTFARAEAALLRGDADAATAWGARRDAVRAVKSSPEFLEIARFLNF